ncbi:linoleate 13S-lipoxygenase 2-1, chloroplastic-like [Cornus florida]|uniref:linoleate 13S-lipoxygenase 2-1, chloroplastic-like n=1 Tax=Cornus florida TaxID=4283 RepID=UPI0028A09967|nr:linoleate 13S-lipoxygenase 2-1, chloroplastic-like [Cornus florida]
MLNTPVLIHQSRYSAQSLFQWHKPFVSGNHTAYFTLRPKPDCGRTQKNISVSFVPGNNIKAKATSVTDNSIGVKAVVTSQPSGELILELVSCELDPNTGLEKPTIKMRVKGSSADETDFSVPRDFGKIGAVLVQNEHNMEMYVEKIELVGFPNGPVHITCNSYVQPKSYNPEKRIFFFNKSYFPSQTPIGLKSLRQKELENLHGDGQGERRSTDRIYDYDVYNDLGDPDRDVKFARPVLGGKKHPYPRRCKTGRVRCEKDPLSDTRSYNIYVPRDEAFSDVKNWKTVGDKFSWLRGNEFSRQILAGVNPCTIELVTEWPLKSKLDPNVYGPPESAITKELVEQDIGGFMKLEEALEKKRLFRLDYHDLLLPYVNKVRGLSPSYKTTLYGSRTLFFLTTDGTLRPLAIELTRPPEDGKPQWKQVFTPDWTATGCWLWRLAKVHVLAHDSGVHQLISHWLRTHCCVEPYIIATYRQLSAMHPIYRILRPHLRYTMKLNALARQLLNSAEGLIESSFSPGKYAMELSSVVYDQQWRFDLQALPADLISRGMAVEDEKSPHGLKLAIEDYPFANDGLLLWDAIEHWVTEYVSYYYPNGSPDLVESDQELQAWWTEIRTVGHGNKKEGWPELKTTKDLIGILTTMIWVATGHHAAVNFGQFDYAGYFPNRPTIARENMPTEEPTKEQWEAFLKNPQATFMMCFPSPDQALKIMGILNVLSNHSPDEEYIGEKMEAAWIEEPDIKKAFERFNGKLKKIESIIDSRNTDFNLKNRSGAGVVPYELLKPFSESGVTGKGVPNSISI